MYNIDTEMWITSTPDTCLGSPRLKRTRIRVSEILDIVKNNGEAEVYRLYPYITKSAIDACRLYRYNHTELVDKMKKKNKYICAFLSSALGLSQDDLEIKRDPITEKLDRNVLEKCIIFISKCENVIDNNATIALVEGTISLGFPHKQTYVDFYEENHKVKTEIAYYGHIDWKETKMLRIIQEPKIISFDEFMKLWK